MASKKTAEEAVAAGDAAVVKTLPPVVMKRVDALSDLQKEYETEYLAFVAERKAMEHKFEEKYNAILSKRAAIVKGDVDPAAGTEVASGAGDAPKGIENFWLQAMQNHRMIGSTIEEHDEEILKHLTDITIKTFEDGEGFELVFHFAPNDYFTNATLSKKVTIPRMLGGLPIGKEGSVDKLEGTEVDWKSGKNVTVKLVKKQQKKKGKKVTVTKEEPQESFFRFFETPIMDEDHDFENEEEMYETQEQVSMQAQVALALKDKIVPRGVEWFTGEAVDDEDDEDEDDYDEDDDEDYDDEDDEDEEEEGGRRGRGPTKAQAQQIAAMLAQSMGKGKGKGKKDEDEDEDDEDDEDEAEDGTRAALADAFKKGAKVDGDSKDKDGKKDGDKAPECKQQ